MDSKTDVAPDVWGYKAEGWDAISFGLSDAIGWAVQALCPRPGEKVLDIGTGSGWAARMAAGMGAEVTGVDPSPAMLDAARNHAPPPRGSVTYTQAAAENLPFADDSFDAILSTYGIMFSSDPKSAIDEMVRVLKPRGRLSLTTWKAEENGYIPDFFALVTRYADMPPPDPSPMDWGDPDWLRTNLGRLCDIGIRPVTTWLYAPDAQTVWNKYIGGFGPMALAYEALSADQRERFQTDFVDLHAPHDDGHGLAIRRKAMLITAQKQ